VELPKFRRNDQDVKVTVNTFGKQVDQRGQGRLKILSNGGRASIQVSFEVVTPKVTGPLYTTDGLPYDFRDPRERLAHMPLMGRDQELKNLGIPFVRHQGRHYLLYGYGKFGATATINHLLRRAEARLEALEGRGVLMTIHLDLRWRETGEVVEGMVDEFCCEVVRGDFSARGLKRLMKQLEKQENLRASRTKKGFKIEAAFPSIGAEFSRETDSTGMLPVHTPRLSENDILKLTEQWLSDDPRLLERMVNRLLSRGSSPACVVFILDKVDAPEKLEALRRSRIFHHEKIDFIAVIQEEDLSLIHISEPRDRTRSRMPSSA